MPGDWLRIDPTDPEWPGRLRMAGWMHDVITGQAGPLGPVLRYAICPVCSVTVLADAARNLDRTWDHERWHARTDHPVPVAMLTDDDLAAGYGGTGHRLLPVAEVGAEGRYVGRCSCGWRAQTPRSDAGAAHADASVHAARNA